MKKISFLLFFLPLNILLAQTQLSSVPLTLNKTTDKREALTAVDSAARQMVVFAADKEKLRALRFNRALFFTDSLSVPRPDKQYDYMAGYSFSGSNPAVYWASSDLKKIEGLYFDIASKKVSRVPFAMPFNEREILASFSANNAFYIVTLHAKEDRLVFYAFANGRYTSYEADLSEAGFTSASAKKSTFRALLERHGLQKIDRRGFIGLTEASSKIKLYDTPGAFVLTIDTNPAFTHVLTIDAATFTISRRMVTQPRFAEEADANSFYLEGNLYQIKANDEELALVATDLSTGKVIGSHMATAEENITFKNTPLLSVSANRQPQQFKDTKKFLRRLSSGTAAISVYQTPDDIRIMAGGVRSYIPAGTAILGGTLTLAGGSVDMLDAEETQVLWFESLFDDTFAHRPYTPGILAGDRISQFTHDIKNLQLLNVVPFHYYYVVGYYDAKLKRYVQRKFEDDYAY